MDPEESIPQEVAEEVARNIIQTLDQKEDQQGALEMGDYLAREWARDNLLKTVIGQDEASRGRRKDLANKGINGDNNREAVDAMKAQLDEELFYGIVNGEGKVGSVDRDLVERIKKYPYPADLIKAIQRAESSRG